MCNIDIGETADVPSRASQLVRPEREYVESVMLEVLEALDRMKTP